MSESWMLAGHQPPRRRRGPVHINGRTCWTLTKGGRTATAVVAVHPMGRELWVLINGELWASKVHPSDEAADQDAGERFQRGLHDGWVSPAPEK